MFRNFDHTGVDALINKDINPSLFIGTIRHLQVCFDLYVSTCPSPLPAPGLIVTQEIRCQSEFYLPIAEITAAFNRLYRSALTYPPILSSTPFFKALSWADLFISLPRRFQFSTNPAYLLEALLADHNLLTEFLFASFLPLRFYGSFGRYPRQQEYIRGWLNRRDKKTVRLLDAACGTGEDTYSLAHLLCESGYPENNVQIEGWTLEPLEVLAAAERCFPHNLIREAHFQECTSWLFEHGYQECIRFYCADLTSPHPDNSFDVILCNGLLGGPIINSSQTINIIVQRLAGMLTPGGILLAADHFHGGWKQHCPQQELQAVFTLNGLCPVEVGEGIGGLKLHQ